MHKLKMDVTELRVESFEAYAGGARTIGTVRGNVLTPECSVDETCPGATCFEDTCAGCANTSPRPSCVDCSEFGDCFTLPPQCD